MSVNGRCHCGAVSFEVNAEPEWVMECNCSICRRLGVLWFHADTNLVKINSALDQTLRYIHGDKMIAFHTCKTCGCTTHWDNVDPTDNNRMAVNLRMIEPGVLQSLRVRKFDGADTWKFLD